MLERVIKSSERVRKHGEVLTPQSTVDFILDQPKIEAKINELNATFLEPSAGEGAFLVELLKRKLKVAAKMSASFKIFNENSLIALSTLYGIEYLEDNVEMLVMNMITIFVEDYSSIAMHRYGAKPSGRVEKSAKVIIESNMAQGDTLKQKTLEGKSIVFSEWRMIPGRTNKVQRLEYTFESIINGRGPNDTVSGYRKGQSEQLSLFATDNMVEETKFIKKKYAAVSWLDIYKQRIE